MHTGKTVLIRFCIILGVTLAVISVIALNGTSILQDFNSHSSSAKQSVTINPREFVTRSGSDLMLNDQPFRFAGANMHWLGLDDNTNYPSDFQVNDGFATAKEMGATVVRAHSLGISVGCSNCIEPSLGIFNEAALKHNDYVIKTAQEYGLRLIIPLTDNWHYATGGKHTFTDWRKISDENQFYTNTQVIDDFETYIATLLNHVNVYTGVAYKDDPTIMAWETGNELEPPHEWTQLISTYIKQIDNQHLVIDGRHGIDPQAADLTNVDIVSNHYYPMNNSALMQDANIAKLEGKAFLVGEFDWNNANGGDPLGGFLSNIESTSSISGDLYWELWPHNDQYGYINSDTTHMLHYPGDTVAMRKSVQFLRNHAYAMSNMKVPAESIPEAPILNTVIRGNGNNVLEWRGVTLAADYTIERSTASAQGPWTTICDKCATDLDVPWTDPTVSNGSTWYRLIAYNLKGTAGKPSAPYQASSQYTMVDDLDDWSKSYQHSVNLTFDTTNPEYMQGDPSRVERTTATQEFIIWKQTTMVSFQAVAYFWPNEPVSHFSIYTSLDGDTWINASPSIDSIHGNWNEYIYTVNTPKNSNYVKLVWNNTHGQEWSPQLSEITISYQD